MVNLGFGAGDVVHAAEAAADVGAHGVVHQRHIRRGDAGERCQFARVVHAHFYHGVAMLFAQIEQREWQTDVVVEIARRCQHGICVVCRAQDAGEHFFDCGFAARTCDAVHKGVELLAPCGGERLQRGKSVVHFEAA